jgi:hypothetical protein
VFFIIDIVLCFLTTTVDERGHEQTALGVIALEYLRGWFVPDFMAAFPWQILFRTDIEYLIRLVRVLKLPNALNMLDGRGFSNIIAGFRSTADREQTTAINYAVRFWTSLVQMIIIMILVCYTLACFWYWFTKQVDDHEYSYANFIDDSSDHLELDGKNNGI